MNKAKPKRLSIMLKSYLYSFIYLVLIICLPSCMVGPDFVKPSEPTNKTYTEISNLKHVGSHIKQNKTIPRTWWQEFQSAELNNVMAQGIKNNYTLIASKETLQQAKEMVTSISGQLWPQVSLTADVGRQKYGVALFGPSNIVIPPFTYYEIGPSFNYTLDVFGGTRRNIEKQQALASYQQHEFNNAYLTLTANIATTSLNIAIINAQIATTKEIIIKDKLNLTLIEKAFNIGSATKENVLNAQNQLANDETLLPNLYQQSKLAQGLLNILVGKTPADWQPPDFQLTKFMLPDELPLRLPSELVHARPDILAAEEILHAANADVGIATANLYPNITISASTLQEALTTANLFKRTSNTWSYLGNITAPIFNGGALRAQRRAATHAFESAYAHYQHIVLQAFVQVHDILYTLEYDKQTEQLQKKALMIAESSLKLARFSYNAGSIGNLKTIDAERLYLQALLNYTKARGQLYQDTVRLYVALGGGQYSG